MPTTQLAAIIALIQAKQYDQAEAEASAEVAQFPEDGMLWKALGVAQRLQGKDSLFALQQSAMLLPTDAEAQFNLAIALQERGDLKAAVERYREAVVLLPAYAKAWNNLGNALAALGQHQDATQAYGSAIAIDPAFAEAHQNLAAALLDLGQGEAALVSAGRALSINPAYAKAHNVAGMAFRSLGRLIQATQQFAAAIKCDPNFAAAWNNHGMALLALGKLGAAIQALRQAVRVGPQLKEAADNLLFAMSYLGGAGSDSRLQTARAIATAYQPPKKFTTWRKRDDGARLRIGFVSGDLRSHSVTHFLSGVVRELQANHADCLELFAFQNNRIEDGVTARLREQFDHWHKIQSVDDAAAAKLIHDIGIDILVDLSGHTAGNRLGIFAQKPAPVQMMWLGDVASTGLPEIDYALVDGSVAPPETATQYSEKLWKMPHCFVCFGAPEFDLPVSPLPVLTNGHITFGSFNNLAKLSDFTVELWAKVLHAVPNSRLFLNTHQLKEKEICDDVAARFAARGIPADRLELKFLPTRQSSIQAYGSVDIALDPSPYNGGTTSAEALWMGVPVLTLAGDTLAGRLGVSYLNNVGLPDWIANSAEHYVDKAVALSADLASLAPLRANLRTQALASPLFNAKNFAADFTEAMQAMHQANS